MGKIWEKLKLLFNHGLVFYGVAAILLLLAVINSAPTRKSTALSTIDLTGVGPSNATRINTEVVYTGQLNTSVGEGAQGFTATDNHLVVVLTPDYGNMNNTGKNKIVLIDPATMRDVSSSYNNPAFKMGHANGITYNEKTKELIVAASADADWLKGKIYRVNTNTYSSVNEVTQVGANNGTPVALYGITYDKHLDRYYSYNSGVNRITSADFKAKNFFKHEHSQVDQGMAYYNGYFYRTFWEAKGEWEGHPEKNGLFNAYDGVIFQFSAKTGEYTGAWYTRSPSCELEGMAVYDEHLYFLFNSCKNGQRATGYYTIARATNADLADTMFRSYIIDYNTNGGEWENDDAASSMTAYYGLDVKLTTKKPVRQYYDFIGWKLRNSDKIYGSGSTYATNASDGGPLKLFEAAWKEHQYTITYYSNGGSASPISESFGMTREATITRNYPTRDGYRLLGWSTNKNATSPEYTGGATYYGKQDLKLYAVWEAERYTVTYDANGGTGAPAAQTAEISQSIVLSNDRPTRNNYDFKGWTIDLGTNAIDYRPGETYNRHKNATLYAVWSIQEYTISFDANGGKNAPASITAPKTLSSVTIPSVEPTRSGYVFKGWSKTPGGRIEYSSGDSYSGRADITLYAVWEAETVPRTSYLLSFDANGGKNAPSRITVSAGDNVAIPETQPVRDGYVFSHWNMSADDSDAAYNAGGYILIQEDTTLYAIWRVGPIKISYDANGGTGAPAAQTGLASELHISNDMPTRSGYVFVGWMVDGESTVSYRPGQKYYGATSVTLKAAWQQSAKTIKYYVDAREAGSSPILMKSQGVLANSTAKIISDKPTRGGLKFLGWNKSRNAKAADYEPGDEILISEDDVVLYAVWSSSPYTVYFDANGSDDAAPSPLSAQGDVVKIPSATISRFGYKFLGWSNDPNGATAQYKAGDYYLGAKNIVLFAVWQQEMVGEDVENDESISDGSDVPASPNTEAIDIYGYLPVLSCAFIGLGILASRSKRR